MENQTRFDLNVAVENWRQEMAAQPNLAFEDRRELETRLRDTIAELCRRGLNEEESFWLARRRVGQPQQLGEEFVKGDPEAVWRERVFWMALSLLGFSLWTGLVCCIPLHNWNKGFFGLLSAYTFVLLIYVPLIGLAILLAKGKLDQYYYTLAAFFKSRWRFATCAIFFLVLTDGYQALAAYNYRIQTDHGHFTHTLDGFWLTEFSVISLPLMLIGLVTWLMPTQNRRTKKGA